MAKFTASGLLFLGCRLLFAVCILRVCDDFALNFTNRFLFEDFTSDQALFASLEGILSLRRFRFWHLK